MKKERLNIIDEDGNIIGEDTRENIHQKGLLHREINVYFYTPNGEIIFQHRGKNKDTFPNMLGVTVGGHVELGGDFLTTAIREVEEETGLIIDSDDLNFITQTKRKTFDKTTGNINYNLRMIYAYYYDGKVNDLKVESADAQGFEIYSIDKLLDLSDKKQSRFLPSIIEKEKLDVIKDLINSK